MEEMNYLGNMIVSDGRLEQEMDGQIILVLLWYVVRAEPKSKSLNIRGDMNSQLDTKIWIIIRNLLQVPKNLIVFWGFAKNPIRKILFFFLFLLNQTAEK